MQVSHWRHGVLIAFMLGSLLLLLGLAPIAQDASYHDFADTRAFLGIPNFLNLVTNLPFLLIGLLGLKFCWQEQSNAQRSAWMVLFTGLGLVGIGSAYYHWQPGNLPLVWDRLPITIGFMGLFVALLGEYISDRLSALLAPAVMIGLGAVAYGYYNDDLRLYVWVQLAPLLAIPLLMILYRSNYSHGWLMLVALACYLLAKLSEHYDLALYELTGAIVSGHTIKHLLAGLACLVILRMLQMRSLNG